VGRVDVPSLARSVDVDLIADSDDVLIRRASVDDLPAILELARRSLGWNGDDDDERFFRWKHLENPLGPSPMWVATVGGRVVGFRTFLRWQFARTDDSRLLAVRAVDTATDPDYQGRGIFSRLTLHAIDELRDEGVGIIFNTPNTKSLPGYLKMGWHIVGRPAVSVMPTGLHSLWQLAGARTAASRNPVEMRVGEAPEAVFGDVDAVARLFARVPSHIGLATMRTPEYLRWRYGFAPLRYRVMLHTSTPDDGLAVFHLRRRGRAIEATVCDVMTPASTPGVEHQLMKKIAELTQADYLLRIDRRKMMRGFLPVPRNGPVLTFRSIDGRKAPTLDDLSLSMGDVELF
jgi:GNAT superfamily N-acetyltransferase